MSIMSDARLRLLEARVAELEKRLAAAAPPGTGSGVADEAPNAKPKVARKPRRQSRKRP